MLPQKFTERMQDMLGEEYPAFLESYKEDRIQGLRVNTLKGTAADFLTRAPFSLEPIPWSQSGFYYDSASQPGKHPYHEAGVYYIPVSYTHLDVYKRQDHTLPSHTLLYRQRVNSN